MSTSLEVWWLAAIVAASFALYQAHVYWRNQREARLEIDRRGLTARVDSERQVWQRELNEVRAELAQVRAEQKDDRKEMDRLRSANGSLAESITLMAEIVSRLAPSSSGQRAEFDVIVDTLHRNLREQGLSINATGDVTIGGDVTGRNRVGG